MRSRPRLAGWGIAATVAICAAPALAQSKHALVIGLDTYTSPISAVPSLNFAVRDAVAVAEELKGRGFRDPDPVVLVNDQATRERVIAELTAFSERVREGDTFVLYFAGHGVSREFREGVTRVYWLLRSANLLNLEVEGIRLNHVLQYVDEIRADRKVLILDHCYSGQITTVVSAAGGGSGSRSPSLSPTVASRDLGPAKEMNEDNFEALGSGLVVLGSARGKAYEHESLQHGLFTKLLLDAMRSGVADVNNDGLLGVGEVGTYLDEQMNLQDEQFGVEQIPLTWRAAGSLRDWPLVELSTSDVVDSLRGLVVVMLDEGDLSQAHAIRANLAIDAFATSIETDTSLIGINQEIVSKLSALQESGLPANLMAASFKHWLEHHGGGQ